MARAVLTFDDLLYDVALTDLSDDINELLREHHAFLGLAATLDESSLGRYADNYTLATHVKRRIYHAAGVVDNGLHREVITTLFDTGADGLYMDVRIARRLPRPGSRPRHGESQPPVHRHDRAE